jgi:hypothetical protein
VTRPMTRINVTRYASNVFFSTVPWVIYCLMGKKEAPPMTKMYNSAFLQIADVGLLLLFINVILIF